MNRSEKFTTWFPAKVSALFAAQRVWRSRYAELALDHDALAGFESVVNDDQVALALPGSDRPEFGGRILFDDVDKRPLRRHLRRVCRN